MNIANLLSPDDGFCPHTNVSDGELMPLWTKWLRSCGFKLMPAAGNCKLTDAILEPEYSTVSNSQHITSTPIHVKIVGRHMNGSYRCHIGIGKASRPICSSELDHSMRLLAVFFRPEKSKSLVVSPDFILFPTWLLHLFQYTRHANTPGRTDIRLLEDEKLAKEDHIYRLNHVINTLFRFNLYDFDATKLRVAVELANFLFNAVSLDEESLPCPVENGAAAIYRQPLMYPTLLSVLRSPRPPKTKAVCRNCNTKPASRRKLCVACYRYLLKHGESRPLRLIIASRHKRHANSLPSPTSSFYHNILSIGHPRSAATNAPAVKARPHDSSATADVKKLCANCGVQITHQWCRSPNGNGYWCETCKSFYIRHSCTRPSQPYIRTARHKVNARTLPKWPTLNPEDTAPEAAYDVNAASAMVFKDQTAPYPSLWLVSSPRLNSPHSNLAGNGLSVADEGASASSRPSSPLTPRPIQLALYKPSGHFYEPENTFSSRFEY